GRGPRRFEHRDDLARTSLTQLVGLLLRKLVRRFRQREERLQCIRVVRELVERGGCAFRKRLALRDHIPKLGADLVGMVVRARQKGPAQVRRALAKDGGSEDIAQRARQSLENAQLVAAERLCDSARAEACEVEQKRLALALDP